MRRDGQAAFGAGPDGEALFDEVLRQRVERCLGLVLDAGDLDLGFGERAAANMRVEEVRGLVKLRDGDAGGQFDDAVLDVAVLRHQHGQRLGGFELDELDVLQRDLVGGGEHEAGAARHARQQRAGLGQHLLQRGAGARRPDLRLDDTALLLGEVAEFHEGVDEEAQALLGRQAAGRDVRRIDEAKLLEVAHHVAHGGGRERRRQHARQAARADRLAVAQIGFDDAPENIARAHVEQLQILVQHRLGHRQQQSPTPRYRQPAGEHNAPLSMRCRHGGHQGFSFALAGCGGYKPRKEFHFHERRA